MTKPGLAKLERVMWRIRERNPHIRLITNHELRKCIMMECGVYPETISRNRTALKTLGWISKSGTQYVWITNKDITGDY